MPLLSRTGPILVNAPPPEKYAVHKLLVYGERPQSMRIKAGKDLIQAAALIEYLAENDAQALQVFWDCTVLDRTKQAHWVLAPQHQQLG